ncbi:hypothetical protein VTO42DRAFT_2840 [Malbranchea cinnamomea]
MAIFSLTSEPGVGTPGAPGSTRWPDPKYSERHSSLDHDGPATARVSAEMASRSPCPISIPSTASSRRSSRQARSQGQDDQRLGRGRARARGRPGFSEDPTETTHENQKGKMKARKKQRSSASSSSSSAVSDFLRDDSGHRNILITVIHSIQPSPSSSTSSFKSNTDDSAQK